MNHFFLLLSIVVGTWNGNWFPSGNPDHRPPADVEEATLIAAAKMLADGLKSVDPCGTNDVILCLNEIRGPRIASNLVARIGHPGLRVAIVTGYRRRDRFDQQQDVIATTLPVAESHWSRWKDAKQMTPPRGYAFAAVVISPAITANVYAVHLKANNIASTPELRDLNREKRTVAIAQLIEQERPKRGKTKRPVVLAGDMNADCWKREFVNENTFLLLGREGFMNSLALLPAEARCTHLSKRYGDATFDYVFCRGFSTVKPPVIIPNNNLSDHRALFVLIDSISSNR